MTAEVAVFGFTLKPETYTYLWPDGTPLQPGLVVTVPFGKRSRRGVVISSGKPVDESITLKPIVKLDYPQPIITPYQLELAGWMAKTYAISLAEALHLILPHLPRALTPSYQTINKAINQELVLFPSLRQAQLAAEKTGGLIFTHSDKAKEYELTWNKIARGEAKLILGTRSALFAPFSNLRSIVIYQTESDLYKEERRPYYRAFDVARALAKISQADLTAVSYSPRVSDQFVFPHELKKLPRLPEIKIANLRKVGLVNPELESFLEENSNRRTLVFLNRRSERGPLICRVCKTRAYVADPSRCPNCGSADVKFQLFNLASLEKKLQTDNNNTVFATQQIFFQDTKAFDAVALVSADNYLNSANYLANEKTFQMVTNLLRLLKPGGKLLFQSAHLDNPGLQEALAGDYLGFYKQELKERRESGYPPFSDIAKLTYGEKTDAPPEPKIARGIELFGPFDGGKYPYFILRGRQLANLGPFDRPWKLDIDPSNL